MRRLIGCEHSPLRFAHPSTPSQQLAQIVRRESPMITHPPHLAHFLLPARFLLFRFWHSIHQESLLVRIALSGTIRFPW
jgi:hypothetical protein